MNHMADLNPADDHHARQLHHYWTRGPGLAKWANHAHPYTALYMHLAKYMAPEKAKATAAAWFRDVFGIYPGQRPRNHK